MLQVKAKGTSDFLIKLRKELPESKRKNLEIRYFNNVPLYCSIIRVDDEFFVCNYLSSTPSNDSPFFKIEKGSCSWFPKYEFEFESVWKSAIIANKD